jgi:hypothetical protein
LLDRLLDGARLLGSALQRALDRSVLRRLLEVRVVFRAPLLRREHVVRERHAREDRLDLRLVRAEVLPEVAVRVELRRELVIRRLDLLLVGVERHAEEVVIRRQIEPRVEVEDPAFLVELQVDLFGQLGGVVARGRTKGRGRHGSS